MCNVSYTFCRERGLTESSITVVHSAVDGQSRVLNTWVRRVAFQNSSAYVDIQAAFEDVLVCHVILMAQFLLSTSTVLY